MKKVTDGLLGYLTDEARRVLDEMISMGFDQDLALIYLDQRLPECKVWKIDEEEGIVHDNQRKDSTTN